MTTKTEQEIETDRLWALHRPTSTLILKDPETLLLTTTRYYPADNDNRTQFGKWN